MKRKISVILLAVVMLAGLVGCADIQQKWDKLTPDQKARIIISDFQGQLENAFTQGKAFVTANPKYQEKWKKEIIPAMDVANKTLGDVIELGKTQPLSPDLVYAKVGNLVQNVFNLLSQLGVKL